MYTVLPSETAVLGILQILEGVRITIDCVNKIVLSSLHFSMISSTLTGRLQRSGPCILNVSTLCAHAEG